MITIRRAKAPIGWWVTLEMRDCSCPRAWGFTVQAAAARALHAHNLRATRGACDARMYF